MHVCARVRVTHTCVHVPVSACKCVFVYRYLHECVHTCERLSVHTYMCMDIILECVNAYVRIKVPVCLCVGVHVNIRVYTRGKMCI